MIYDYIIFALSLKQFHPVDWILAERYTDLAKHRLDVTTKIVRLLQQLIYAGSCILWQECNLEEVEEEEPSKSSKDSKKANGPEKTPSLVFKITNRVAYKTVLKG